MQSQKDHPDGIRSTVILLWNRSFVKRYLLMKHSQMYALMFDSLGRLAVPVTAVTSVFFEGAMGVGEATVGSSFRLGGGALVGSEVEGRAEEGIPAGGRLVLAGTTRTVAVVRSEDPAESVTVSLDTQETTCIRVSRHVKHHQNTTLNQNQV